jgi:hypothetical protein
MEQSDIIIANLTPFAGAFQIKRFANCIRNKDRD